LYDVESYLLDVNPPAETLLTKFQITQIQNIGKYTVYKHINGVAQCMVRPSVFGWLTFADLRLVYG